MQAVLHEAQKKRGVATFVEEAPIASHASVGGVERYHRLLQEEVRALKLGLERNLAGKVLVSSHPLAAWLVRHASWALFRFHVVREWQSTAYRRVRGSDYAGAIASFGEVVLARRPEEMSVSKPMSKWSGRWAFALWIGRSEESNEHVCLHPDRLARHRVVRRLPAEDSRRWSADLLDAVRVLPWDMQNVKDNIVETRPLTYMRGPREVEEQVRQQILGDLPQAAAERSQAGLRRPFTPSCSACRAMGTQQRGYHHSIPCRRVYRQ